MSRLRFSLVLVLLLATTLAAQEKPLTPTSTFATISPEMLQLSQAEWTTELRLAADAPDTMRVCVDDAMTICLTLGEIRALAHPAGELGPADRDHRDLMAYQSLYVTTLGQVDECRGQLGPFRMQANARAIEEQFTAWIADLEKRTGMVYDRQTGALTPKKEGS